MKNLWKAYLDRISVDKAFFFLQNFKDYCKVLVVFYINFFIFFSFKVKDILFIFHRD